jgi:large subunit ribosomal protein L31e
VKTNKEKDITEEEQKPLEEQEERTEIAKEPEVKGENAEEIPKEEEKAEEKKEETLEELVGAEEEALTPAEEEPKPPAKEEKAEEEEEIIEERTYTIPLGKALIMPPRRRAPRAMRMIRAFINKHMKLEARKEGEEEEEEPAQLVISSEVNEKVWEKGIEKPPRKIRVRAAKDKDGNVTVYLAEGD